MEICPSLLSRERTDEVLGDGEAGSGTEHHAVVRRGRRGAKRRNWIALDRGGTSEARGRV
jgi:hypothetical protein